MSAAPSLPAFCTATMAMMLLFLDSWPGLVAQDQQGEVAEAIGLLRGLENIRLQAEPFTLRGEVQRLDSGGVTLVKFNADSESEKYRIRVDVPKAAVAMSQFHNL